MINLTALLRQWFEKSSRKQKLTAALLILGLLATAALLNINGTPKTAADPLGSTPLYIVSVFIKLIGVLLLIFACSIIFRRWLQFGPNRKAIRQMRLLETVRLSPRQALHLVSVGDRQILIGATDQNISLLSQIEGSLTPEAAADTNPQARSDFGTLLHSVSTQQLTGDPSK